MPLSSEGWRNVWALPSSRPKASSHPTRLVIPKIKLDTQVVLVGPEAITVRGVETFVWGTPDDAAGFHQTSAYPGQGGNTVINGHRDIKGSVFLRLDKMKVNDQIILYVGDIPYYYYVTETIVMPETFASAEQHEQSAQLIGPMPEERLTLVTCTPIGLATHRLLVIAKP